jgi:hypothetical protein
MQIYASVREQQIESANEPELKRLVVSLRELGEQLEKVILESTLLARGRIARATPEEAFSNAEKARTLGWKRPIAELHSMLPAARTLNLRDVLELLRWHNFRLDILDAELKREPLADVLDKRRNLPTGSGSVGPRQPTDPTAVTGYCCSGSWLVGVGRRTHNPLLSWKLMEEMTSFDVSVRRSKEAAGIPVRKDFYDICGSEPVKHANHLTWNDLLLFGGARARRRDRTLCHGINAEPVFNAIHRHVLQCLTVAKSWREVMADTKEWSDEDLKKLNQSAEAAVREIFESVAKTMNDMLNDMKHHGATCASCPDAGMCAKLIVKRNDDGSPRPVDG